MRVLLLRSTLNVENFVDAQVNNATGNMLSEMPRAISLSTTTNIIIIMEYLNLYTQPTTCAVFLTRQSTVHVARLKILTLMITEYIINDEGIRCVITFPGS